MTRLVLYMRRYCHLCHEMRDALLELEPEIRPMVDEIDIDEDPALEERFGEVVPVLFHAETEIARVRLDVEAVRAYLVSHG